MDEVPIRSKIIYTISLNVSYFIYGIGSNMLGLTLIDMANLLGVGLDEISYSLSVKSAFYTIGSLICILTLKKFNRQVQTALSFMFLGVALTLIPISKNLNQCYLWEAVAGLCSSTIEVVCNVWMLEIWKEGNSNHRHMQSLNFFLSLGNILAPIITVPFLSTENQVLKDLDENLNKTQNQTTNIHLIKTSVISSSKYLDTLLVNSFIDNSSYDPINNHQSSKSQIHIPYAIIGFIIFITGLIINLLYLFVPYDDKYKQKDDLIMFPLSNHNRPKEKTLSLSNIYYWSNLILCCTCNSLLFAMTINNNSYIQAFGVESELKLSKTTGSYLMLTYSSVLTFACFCFVIISTKLSPKFIILTDLVLLVISNCILIFSNDKSIEMLWFSIILLAIGMSSLFPSLFSYMKQRIDVNNNVGSVIIFSGSIIGIIYPIIEGIYIQQFPLIFPLINLFSLIIMIVLFTVLIVFELYYNSKQRKQMFIKKSFGLGDNDLVPDAYKNTHL